MRAKRTREAGDGVGSRDEVEGCHGLIDFASVDGLPHLRGFKRAALFSPGFADSPGALFRHPLRGFCGECDSRFVGR